MKYTYAATDRKVIERQSDFQDPQVVASGQKKICRVFLEHVLAELNRVEAERERMAVIVRRQAKELAQLKIKCQAEGDLND